MCFMYEMSRLLPRPSCVVYWHAREKSFPPLGKNPVCSPAHAGHSDCFLYPPCQRIEAGDCYQECILCVLLVPRVCYMCGINLLLSWYVCVCVCLEKPTSAWSVAVIRPLKCPAQLLNFWHCNVTQLHIHVHVHTYIHGTYVGSTVYIY